MYSNHPTPQSESLARLMARREKERRRSALINRIVWTSFKALLAATLVLAVIKSI